MKIPKRITRPSPATRYAPQAHCAGETQFGCKNAWTPDMISRPVLFAVVPLNTSSQLNRGQYPSIGIYLWFPYYKAAFGICHKTFWLWTSLTPRPSASERHKFHSKTTQERIFSTLHSTHLRFLAIMTITHNSAFNTSSKSPAISIDGGKK